MGIQSTKHVTRDWAINRIQKIYDLALDYDFKEIDSICSEFGENSVEDFVLEIIAGKDSPANFFPHLSKWSNDQLADVLDMPFFRESIFDNYLVEVDYV